MANMTPSTVPPPAVKPAIAKAEASENVPLMPPPSSARATRPSVAPAAPSATPQQFPGDPKRRVATPTTVLGVSAATVPWPVPVAGLVSVAHATPDGRGAASALLEPAPAVVPQAATSERRSPTPVARMPTSPVQTSASKVNEVVQAVAVAPSPGVRVSGGAAALSPGAALAAGILAGGIADAPRADSFASEAPSKELLTKFSAIASPPRAGIDPATAASRDDASAGGKKRARSAEPAVASRGKKSGGAAKGPTAAKETKKETEIGDAANVTVAPADVSSHAAGALFAALMPPAKKRKARRWLTDDQKTFVCGIDGCDRSYGSASSLCAHKRAHHPGWKEDRKKQREVEAAAALARGDAPDADAIAKKEEDDAVEDGGEDGDDGEEGGDADVAGRAARKEGAAALDATARATISGAWIESLAADAHGRLGALRRSRQRVQRGVRDARVASAKRPPPSEGEPADPAAAAEAVAAAAAARLLQQMEFALEAETEKIQGWLEKLERVAALRMSAGKILGVVDADLPSDAAAAAETATRISAAVAEAASKHRSTTRKSAGAAADRKHQSLKAAERRAEDEEKIRLALERASARVALDDAEATGKRE